MPETDNLIRWAVTSIFHDGYELSRFMKVQTILNISNNLKIQPLLRVCYNEYKQSLNCCKCEKCCRTIFSIQLNGMNPNDFGFETSHKVYDKIISNIKSGFKTHGTKMYWDEMLCKYDNSKFYFFEDYNFELKKINLIFKTFDLVKNDPIGILSNKSKFKYSLINKFPKLFQFYLKLRRKL
jgi:hypothetical protein